MIFHAAAGTFIVKSEHRTGLNFLEGTDIHTSVGLDFYPVAFPAKGSNQKIDVRRQQGFSAGEGNILYPAAFQPGIS